MVNRVPARAVNNWNNGKAFSSQRKSHKILEKSGKLRQMLFIYLVKGYLSSGELFAQVCRVFS